ncbi:MAG: lipoyl(octanoyl) transferase LipB [Rhodospirillales bacterium]|nr:lipoyl(octanoyl) transferase LipB [Rhodospirillales bacterium]
MQRQGCARATRPFAVGDDDRHEWLKSVAPVAYPTALQFMERRVNAIIAAQAPEAIWLLEHPPIYTCGTSAADAELLDRQRFPVYRTGRGGRITYHGPGQRVGYVMLDLKRRGADVHNFVASLEAWLIASLASFEIKAHTSPGRIGIWVDTGFAGEAKIAAIGVRVRRWVSFHGFALNVAPNLEHFAGIVPCGIADRGVTSLRALGLDVDMADVDAALRTSFPAVFTSSSASRPVI